MKGFFNRRVAPVWGVLWGCIGFGLQLWLQKTGLDASGLYIRNHIAAVLSFSLIPLALGTLLLCIRPLKGIRKTQDALPENVPSGFLSLAAAALLLFSGIRGTSLKPTGLETLRVWGTLLCGITIGAAGILSLMKKKVPFGIYAAIALFLILYVVGGHRIWSAEPQVSVFLFPLLAGAFLLISAYQQAALAAGCGHSALSTFFHAGAVYFCLTTLPQNGVFYCGMALWLLAQCPLPLLTEDRP